MLTRVLYCKYVCTEEENNTTRFKDRKLKREENNRERDTNAEGERWKGERDRRAREM